VPALVRDPLIDEILDARREHARGDTFRLLTVQA
jgi:hypothetical protein